MLWLKIINFFFNLSYNNFNDFKILEIVYETLYVDNL